MDDYEMNNQTGFTTVIRGYEARKAKGRMTARVKHH